MAALSPHSVGRKAGCGATAVAVVFAKSKNSARALCSSTVCDTVPDTGTASGTALWGHPTSGALGFYFRGLWLTHKCQWRCFGLAWRLLALVESPAVVSPVAHSRLSWWHCRHFMPVHVPGWVQAQLYPCSGFLSVRADYSAKAAMWQTCLHCFTELGCLLSPSIIFRAGNRILMVEVQIRFSCRTLAELAARGTCWFCREQDHCAKNQHQSWVLEYIRLHQNSFPVVCILSCWWEA